MSDCLFCKIVSGEIPCKKVYEDKDVLVFHDINPKAPVHLLVVPREHIRSVTDMHKEDEKLFGHMINVAKEAAINAGLKGWKMLFNVEKEGGQVIFHTHLHILGGGKIKYDET